MPSPEWGVHVQGSQAKVEWWQHSTLYGPLCVARSPLLKLPGPVFFALKQRRSQSRAPQPTWALGVTGGLAAGAVISSPVACRARNLSGSGT